MKTDDSGYPLLMQFSEDFFVDCVLRIVDVSTHKSHHRLRLRASHGGHVVGMNAVVVRNIQSGLDADLRLIREHVYHRGVAFHRSGPESDLLLNVIAEA